MLKRSDTHALCHHISYREPLTITGPLLRQIALGALQRHIVREMAPLRLYSTRCCMLCTMGACHALRPASE